MNERTKKILSEKAKLRMNEESRKKFISDMQKTKIKLGLNKICKKGKEHPNTKTILQVCRDTGKILNIFESSYLAQEKTKVNQSDIIKNCNKKIFQAGGYFWFYKEEYNKSSFEEAKNNFLNRHNYCSIKIKIINELNEELIFLSIKKASKYLNVSDTYLISLIKLNGNNFFKKIKNIKLLNSRRA